MKTQPAETRAYNFSFPALDTLVQVEQRGGAIVIRTSRDTFSADRRKTFIRELASEGFIPEECRWQTTTPPGADFGVRWLVDATCFLPDAAHRAKTSRTMLRLLTWATLLWVLLIGLLFASRLG